MENKHFDALVRSLAKDVPRRRIIGAIAAGSAMSLLGRLRTEAAADCKKVGRKCQRSRDCCDGARCVDGECVCKDGRDECNRLCVKLASDERHCGACGIACDFLQTCCSGQCVNLRASQANCGACGVACTESEICCGGECVERPGPGRCGPCTLCPLGQTCCDGECVNLQRNEEHCGACGNPCDSPEKCENGQCVVP